jgi:hypothetical protein
MASAVIVVVDKVANDHCRPRLYAVFLALSFNTALGQLVEVVAV